MFVGNGSSKRLIAVAAVLAAVTGAGCSRNGDSGSRDSPPSGVSLRGGGDVSRGGPFDKGPFVARFPKQKITDPPPDWMASACALPREYVRRIHRGYMPGRSVDIVLFPRAPNGFPSTHAGPDDFLQRVPLVFYGPGFIRAQGRISIDREATTADLAPTVAELIGHPWPEDRAGIPIEEVLVPAAERPGRPRLVVQIVWDGGGNNVLATWPNAWPNLRRLIAGGTAVNGGIAGSSPSNTPPIHATIGTGTFANQHGIVDTQFRIDGEMTKSWGEGEDMTPTNLILGTLADMYDKSTGNEAKIGLVGFLSWHLGLIGHGAMAPGGDKDIAVIIDEDDSFGTNRSYYRLPSYMPDVPGLERYIDELDAEDGKRDDRWLDNSLLEEDEYTHKTPAWSNYQTDLITALLNREDFGADEVPDLFYTNYKQIDLIGHAQGILSEEMPATMYFGVDAQLPKLVGWLNAHVGKKRWVIALTADHGPALDNAAVGGWAIHFSELYEALEEQFGVPAEDLIEERRPNGLWLDQEILDQAGLTAGDVADYLITYRLRDDIVDESGGVPAQFQDRLDEPLFASAFPSDQLDAVWRCVN